MQRIYLSLIHEHLQQHQQMLLLAGPRQVGKTTLSLSTKTFSDNFFYFNWDTQEHRQLILKGPVTFAQQLKLEQLRPHPTIVVLDEIHKYAKWKTFLKGLYDNFKHTLKIIVTGSAKLNVYRSGGDSLMGRYFLYRIHPFTIAEALGRPIPITEISPPQLITQETFNALWEFGGFPEPFLKANPRFSKQWHNLHQQQLFREDIRDLSDIQTIAQLEVLAQILQQQVGQLVDYTALANKVNVAVNTIKRWLHTLEHFYYGFRLQPWTQNIARSLLKQPKWFLWDWSEIADVGARAENFVASHLLKAVHFWTDSGLGKFDLHFLRDKEKREVDFLVSKNNQPWFLVEVKYANNQGINPALYHFQKQLQAPHAFQVVIDMPYVDMDCFTQHTPTIVPARTLLSQLV
jgi:predicted AAA+ superfamily ATPase